MKTHSATLKNIKKAVNIIRTGGLVAFSTETVYGLGADAFNPSAVARVFEVKKRPFFDPLIVHIGDSSFHKIEVLSPSGALNEAAANLFSCLHRLDEAGLDIIYAEPVPEEGLGRAIMDRLRKAAQKNELEGRKF